MYFLINLLWHHHPHSYHKFFCQIKKPLLQKLRCNYSSDYDTLTIVLLWFYCSYFPQIAEGLAWKKLSKSWYGILCFINHLWTFMAASNSVIKSKFYDCSEKSRL